MRRWLFVAGLLTAVSAIFVGRQLALRSSTEVFSDAKSRPPEAAPLCPWRTPEADLKQFFPTATSYQQETHILSGLRAELAQRLGRQATGDENALRVNRVYQGSKCLGAIMTGRVKGEYGSIELVLATDNEQRVRGVRLQRLREPQTTAGALEDTNWLAAFAGKQAMDSWRLGEDIPQVPAAARASAAALLAGTRTLLILLQTAEQAPTPTLAKLHQH